MERKKCNLTAPENTFREHDILVESSLHLSVLKRRARKNNVTIAPNRTLNRDLPVSSEVLLGDENGIMAYVARAFDGAFAFDHNKQNIHELQSTS